MSDLEIRAIAVRATGGGDRTIEGIAVPYNTPTELWPGLREQFATGSITIDDQPPKLFSQHQVPIGTLEVDERDDGAHIIGRISATREGDDVLALVRDGVLDRLSVGFLPLEHTESIDDQGTITITRTKVVLREVSIVTFPAYPDAKITNLRHKEPNMSTDTQPTTDTADVVTRADLSELSRRLDTIAAQTANIKVTDRADNSSVGQILKRLAAGDTAMIDRVTEWQSREYQGFDPAADLPADMPASLINLANLVNTASLTSQLFTQAPLPPTDMQVSYLRIKSVAVKIGKQAKTGDDLPGPSKIIYDTASTPIEITGGWSELDIPRIERLSVNVLDQLMEAMAIEVGVQQGAAFDAAVKKVHDAQVAAGNKLTVADWTKWAGLASAIRQAATAFRKAGATLDGLLLDPASFDALMAMATTNGSPLMLAQGTSVNQIGTATPQTPAATLFGVPVNVIDSEAGDFAMFYNRKALVTRKDPIVTLQDQKIINLTRQWSVYQLAAICDEYPGLVLPMVKA